MRTFIAVELDSRAKEEVYKFKDYIKKSDSIKLVEKNNIHLTLFFLGEFFDENNISSFINEFKKNSFVKIPFKFSKINFFPNELSPRVIWIGIDDNACNSIKLLYNKIKDLLFSYGFESKEVFVPHITLARVKKNKILNKNEIENMKSFFIGGNYLFDSLVLFKSELTSKGPIYSKIIELKSL